MDSKEANVAQWTSDFRQCSRSRSPRTGSTLDEKQFGALVWQGKLVPRTLGHYNHVTEKENEDFVPSS